MGYFSSNTPNNHEEAITKSKKFKSALENLAGKKSEMAKKIKPQGYGSMSEEEIDKLKNKLKRLGVKPPDEK